MTIEIMTPILVPWDGVYDDDPKLCRPRKRGRPRIRPIGLQGVSFTFQIDAELKEQARAWSVKHHCSLAEAIRTFITWGVEERTDKSCF